MLVEEAVEIRVLRSQGKSIREIARMLAVSRNTVRRYLRGDGLPHYERETRLGQARGCVRSVTRSHRR